MGPIWDRQDPGGPHVGPMNFVIWDILGNISIDLYLTLYSNTEMAQAIEIFGY